MDFQNCIILGSQSPQRKMLLQQTISHDRIVVCPPINSEEAGFEGLTNRAAISSRLAEITRTKNDDVCRQCEESPEVDLRTATILTADTIIVVDDEASAKVLGKPDGTDWRQVTRTWFMNHYSGASHEVVSGVCIRRSDGSIEQFESSTKVTFKVVAPEMLEWYLSTEEPLGKAGGYGIQSAGSLFVESIEGSLSNVIGLPLEIVVEQLLL